MVSDIRLMEDSVVVDGNLGIGTDRPQRSLHVEGAEIHSGGPAAGFSFSDRHASGFEGNPGQRWVWYVADGVARLWSGADVLTVKLGSTAEQTPTVFHVDGHLSTLYADISVLNGKFPGGGLAISASQVILSQGPDHSGKLASVETPNVLTINGGAEFRKVSIEGDVAVPSLLVGTVSNSVRADNSGITISEGILGTGPHLKITASGISVTLPRTAAVANESRAAAEDIQAIIVTPSPAHPVGADPNHTVPGVPSSSIPSPTPQTVDLVAEVLALRRELNALKVKVGM